VLDRVYKFFQQTDKFLKEKFKSYTPSVLTIGVGNIQVGGTGKSQLSRLIYISLKELGYKPIILVKGYKGRVKEGLVTSTDWVKWGDEAVENFVLGYKTFVSKDKVKGVKKIEKLGLFDAVIIDDAFQLYGLKKIELLSLNLDKKPEEDKLLPLGRLREELSSIERANACIIFNFKRRPIPQSILKFLVLKPFFEINKLTLKFLQARTENELRNSIVNKKFYTLDEVVIGCAIGNPQSFLKSVEDNGVKVKSIVPFPDHHPINLEKLKSLANSIPILITLKDWVKLSPEQRKDLFVAIPFLPSEVKSFIRKHVLSQV